MPAPTLSDFIALRKRLGYSQARVSEALGLHWNYIRRIERGERPWKPIYYYGLMGIEAVRQRQLLGDSE